MYASLGCSALSAKRPAGSNILGSLFGFLGVTLLSSEVPFAKTPTSWLLIKCETGTGGLAKNLPILRANWTFRLYASSRQFRFLSVTFAQLYPGNRRNSFTFLGWGKSPKVTISDSRHQSRVRKISPNFSCIKFLHIRDVPTQIPGHPGHSV